METMKLPVDMTEIINGLRYSTKTAVLLADDDLPNGKGIRGDGSYQFLYRTKKGRYFLVNFFENRRELNMLEAVNQEDHARALYEGMPIKRVPYEEAFPNFYIEDA